VKPNLSLEELHVVNGLFQHRHCVHLTPAGNQALQDLEPVTDPVRRCENVLFTWALFIECRPLSFFFFFPELVVEKFACVDRRGRSFLIVLVGLSDNST
jgi:hypothetical protein